MAGVGFHNFCEDAEGELLWRIRSVVGEKMPIAITLDPHANVSNKMCTFADIIVSFKTYPHVDMRDTGRHAGEILHQTMAGDIQPSTILARRPMLEEVNGGRTDISPMVDRIAAAREYEMNADVFAVSINAGFASADVARVGPSVLVTGQGDFASHVHFAEAMADDIWNKRFKAFGIDPQSKHVVALKSMQHFRAAFEPIAGQVMVCDSGALCTPRYNRLSYRNVPRPIFPLDQVAS